MEIYGNPWKSFLVSGLLSLRFFFGIGGMREATTINENRNIMFSITKRMVLQALRCYVIGREEFLN